MLDWIKRQRRPRLKSTGGGRWRRSGIHGPCPALPCRTFPSLLSLSLSRDGRLRDFVCACRPSVVRWWVETGASWTRPRVGRRRGRRTTHCGCFGSGLRDRLRAIRRGVLRKYRRTAEKDIRDLGQFVARGRGVFGSTHHGEWRWTARCRAEAAGTLPAVARSREVV